MSDKDMKDVEAKADAFVSLYTQHEQRLRRYIATLLPNKADVDDILQETSSLLWNKFDQYDRERSFVAWAFGFAYNQVRNYRQKQRTRNKYFSDELVESLAGVQERNQDLLLQQRLALTKCMDKLCPEDRSLLEHRYSRGGTLMELAGSVGRTPNALYKALQRIRHGLMRCIRLNMESV